MTQTFWLTASVLILLALCFIVAPLVFHRSGRRAALDLRNQNLLAYRSRLAELDRELEAGTLDQESYQQLRDELIGSLTDDVPDADRGMLDSPNMMKGGRSARVVVLACLIAIPAAAVFFYERWGYMGELEQFLTMQEMAASDGDRRGQMQGLAEQLREKLEASPGNTDGWAMLGRTYMTLEQYPDAAWAFERLAESIEEDPQREATAWGLSAQALFFQSEGQPGGEVQRAIENARAINPDEVNSLGLLGITAFSQQQYEDALNYWERILEVAPDHPQVASIRQGIEEAYQRLGQEMPTTEMPSTAGSADGQGSAGVLVKVEIDPAFADDIADDTALFVFARPVDATGGAPLAVARLTAGQLPAVVRLDDRNAMSPQARISDAESVRVQARLSRSGNAMPQAGDWQGQIDEPVVVQENAGAASEPVTLVIDTQLTN
ncbi:c-type cytochrome biogenesis protein CcmI [Marinobacter confluentis]|uniref:C-type cytochrome biogenesis protein CcmI n=1 Tax=Marinobacter confluentis TaxID=1697557 RepID=A0A4Z1BT96_9GAMM|nr:c-type cytochrome biogenesis protein CcmI [Marinobacter confluentis]TGN41265.1 c-type cytochrome biogenesis protein CcmI [Marinobacter confluentis]